jgi:cytoskeletal protein CcmA (bactofilin family)
VKRPASASTVLPAGARIVGDLMGDGDVEVHGRLKGSIHIAGELHVTKDAVVRADVVAAAVRVDGHLEGRVRAFRQVAVGPEGTLIGDVQGVLAVEEGGLFRGHVEDLPGRSGDEADEESSEGSAETAPEGSPGGGRSALAEGAGEAVDAAEAGATQDRLPSLPGAAASVLLEAPAAREDRPGPARLRVPPDNTRRSTVPSGERIPAATGAGSASDRPSPLPAPQSRRPPLVRAQTRLVEDSAPPAQTTGKLPSLQDSDIAAALARSAPLQALALPKRNQTNPGSRRKDIAPLRTPPVRPAPSSPGPAGSGGPAPGRPPASSRPGPRPQTSAAGASQTSAPPGMAPLERRDRQERLEDAWFQDEDYLLKDK